MSDRPWSGSLKGQPDKRRSQRFVDQHGREWHGSIEIKTGHPTGSLAPTWAGGKTQMNAQGERVPYPVPDYLIPSQVYVAPHPTDHGVLVVRYDKWKADILETTRDYQRRVSATEIKFHGDKANPASPSAQTRELVGEAPPRVEIVLAMEAGNKWALGLSSKMPQWAAGMVPKSQVVETFFPDAEDEDFPDVGDENLDRVFAAAAAQPSTLAEPDRIAALEMALADEKAARITAEDDLILARSRQVVVKPRDLKPKKPAMAGKE